MTLTMIRKRNLIDLIEIVSFSTVSALIQRLVVNIPILKVPSYPMQVSPFGMKERSILTCAALSDADQVHHKRGNFFISISIGRSAW